MVIAPHARFAAGHLSAGGNVVPVVGAMIDRMQQQALVFGLGGEIRFFHQSLGDRQAGLGVAFIIKNVSEANQSLCGDRAG